MPDYGFKQTIDSKQPAISVGDADFNDNDVIIGDGVNNQGYLDGIDWHNLLENNATCTVSWVGSIVASPSLSAQNLWGAKNSAGNSRGLCFFTDSTDTITFRRYDDTNALRQNSIAVPERSLFFFAHRNKGATVSDDGEIFVNNTASRQAVADMNTLTGGMTLDQSWLMANYIQTYTLEGKFGGIWTYTVAHDDDTMDKMFAYLAGRFGTPGA